MKIGYARVSTVDQNLKLQLQSLEAAGCEQIFTDTVTTAAGPKPGLEEAIMQMRAEDTLCVWRLDRLSSSLTELLHLAERLQGHGFGLHSVTEAIDTTSPGGRLFFSIAGAFAQFERDVTRQRNLEGLEVIRAAGKKSGPKPKVADAQWQEIEPRIASGQLSISKAANILGVNKSTISRRYNAARSS